MKPSVRTNQKIETLVRSSGCECKFEEKKDKVVADDEWNEDRERMAQDLLAKDTSCIAPFWQNKYEKEASKNWDKFYKRNTTKFYKDRHYIHLVFPELLDQNTGISKTLLEVGCGVGNAALPLLEITSDLDIYAVDFSHTAIELFQTQPLYDEKRCTTLVHDMTESSMPTELISIADYTLCLFCLSAIHPEKMVQVARNIAAAMKPGASLLFRDYGRYDQAQLRFRPGHKLDENFYIRQDLTRAYYFSLDQVGEIFEKAGFLTLELEYIRRQYVNRKQGVTRFRVWIHGKFQRV